MERRWGQLQVERRWGQGEEVGSDPEPRILPLSRVSVLTRSQAIKPCVLIGEYRVSPQHRHYAFTALGFAALALRRLGCAGDGGIPNFNRLPIRGGCWASTSHISRSQSEMCVCTSGSKAVDFFIGWIAVDDE